MKKTDYIKKQELKSIIENVEAIVWSVLKEAGFNMDKIKIFYDSVGVLTVRDFTFTFYNGIAKLNNINYYNKTLTLDVMRPDYLVHSKITYNFN